MIGEVKETVRSCIKVDLSTIGLLFMNYSLLVAGAPSCPVNEKISCVKK